MTEDEAREALRRAVDAHYDALEKMRRADTAVEREREILDFAEAELAPHSDVAARILEYHKSATRTWARFGGARPSSELPPDLEQAQRAAAAATEQVSVARAVLDALISEARPAQVVAAAAAEKARLAAVALMSVVAERVTERAFAAKGEIERCLTVLDSYRHTFTLEDAANAGASSARGWELSKSMSQGLQYGPNVTTIALWRDWRDALVNDPEAELPPALLQGCEP